MKKKNRKRYTLAERENFHAKRVHSEKATENQRIYSRHWLDGFHDEYAENNIRAVHAEIATCGRDTPKDVRIMLNAYRNGLSAKLRR